jgi:hypothetical protein
MPCPIAAPNRWLEVRSGGVDPPNVSSHPSRDETDQDNIELIFKKAKRDPVRVRRPVSPFFSPCRCANSVPGLATGQ